jgi:diguanylate cyclase (GGDEF)-like protein
MSTIMLLIPSDQASVATVSVPPHSIVDSPPGDLIDLPRRVGLRQGVNRAILSAQLHQHRLALLVLDMNHFRYINISLGATIGDDVLQCVARRLRACVRGSDVVIRTGDDEFVIILGSFMHAQDAGIGARRILLALREPYRIAGQRLYLTGSLGVASYPDDGLEADALLRHADFDLRNAKSAGRSNFQILTSTLHRWRPGSVPR